MFNIIDTLKHLFVVVTTGIAILNPFNVNLPKATNVSPTPTEIIFQLTPTPTPTASPIYYQPTSPPTLPQTAPKTQEGVNTDQSLVDCNFQYNGKIKLKQSECSKSFECQISNKWYIYSSREKCGQDQTNYWTLVNKYKSGSNSLPNYDPDEIKRQVEAYKKEHDVKQQAFLDEWKKNLQQESNSLIDKRRREMQDVVGGLPTPANYQQYVDEFNKSIKIPTIAPTPNCVQPGSIIGTNVIGNVEVCK